MAKKYLSEEMVVDSDDSESSAVEDEEVEAQQTHFEPPRSYIQIKDLKKPQLLNSKEIHSSKKEIWLIKMPKDLDISKIKSIPVDSLGEATDFTTGDHKYSIVEDLTASASTIDSKKNDQKLNILLPDSKSSYKSENGLKIGRFYNIYEKVEIPAINYNKVVVQREDVKQEKDLRMRHFPTGYYIKDFEEAQEPTIPDPDKKRKADDIVDLDDEKKEIKKSRKDKSDKKKKKKKDKKKSE